MKQLRQAIHTALRDDSVTTVGLRTLLGHTATPFGVYYHFLPETPDFSTLHYLTYFFMPGNPPGDEFGLSARRRNRMFSITAWSEDPDKVDDILTRAGQVLGGLRKVTLPTSVVELYQIKLENPGTDLFDDELKVYFRADDYRAWYREDITSA